MGFTASLAGAVTVAVGLTQRRPALIRTGRSYSLLVLLGSLVAFAAMERALITRDFTIEYVARNGSSRTPPLYNFASLWSALEGSILLWALVLSGYTALVVRRFRHRLNDPLVGWAMVTLFVVSLFFFGLMLGPANPFRVFDPPFGYDGPGPNPLLQNHPLMAFHPPMLYLGYVGFTVPFAFAFASLITGRLGEGWLGETRRWTLFAWGFLTAGILLGAWWSYEVLGWGGYWAWDPVENASFLPWLTGTAFLHSVMVQERRGMLRVWNLSLLCATFSLTILGTFLTRSGVLDSVHSFSESPIGPWLLSFLALVAGTSVGLIAWRGDRLRAPGRIDSALSREAAFLANNVLFAGFALVVLLGTVFPLLVEVLQGERLTVGGPYFERMTMPIGLALLFIMAVAPALPWRKATGEVLAVRLMWPAIIGAGAMVAALALGASGVAPVAAFGLGGFGAGGALRQLVLATRRQGWRGLVGRTNGGMIVHLGVVLVAVAFTASSSYATEAELKLKPGDRATVGGHRLEYSGSRTDQAPNKVSSRAVVLVDGQAYEPSLSRFADSTQVIGTPSVRTGLTEDVYVTIVRAPETSEGAITLRVIVQPLVVWLWIGGGTMAFGTILAAFPGRRRRLPLQPASAAVPGVPLAKPEPVGAA